MNLDHFHPLATFEKDDLGNYTVNSWGWAVSHTGVLEEDGPDGDAADDITEVLASVGHPKAHTRALILEVLAGTEESQARLRVLQQQLAEAVYQLAERGESPITRINNGRRASDP